jgi:hypothetical protein
MRRTAVVLAVALLAACGGGGSDGTIAKGEAAKVASHAQLTAKDLGPGWTLTSDVATDPSADDAELQRCVGADIRVGDATLASSHVRTFERTTDDGAKQQIVVTSAVLATAERADRLLATVATQRFAGCTARSFEEELAASGAGVEVGIGATPTVTRGELDEPDHSAHIRAVIPLTADGIETEGTVHLLFASTGQVFSQLLGFAVGTSLDPAELHRLGGLLASRQNP